MVRARLRPARRMPVQQWHAGLWRIAKARPKRPHSTALVTRD
jgi:hypothetical protein